MEDYPYQSVIAQNTTSSLLMKSGAEQIDEVFANLDLNHLQPENNFFSTLHVKGH